MENYVIAYLKNRLADLELYAGTLHAQNIMLKQENAELKKEKEADTDGGTEEARN